MYRVWCKNRKVWEEFVLLTPSGQMLEVVDKIPRPLNPFTHTLQFSTGVCDVNGDIIYEGDLLYCSELSKPIEIWYDKHSGNWLAGVKDEYDDYLWKTLAQFKDCKIIGNIFEGVVNEDGM